MRATSLTETGPVENSAADNTVELVDWLHADWTLK
jgi:hypothetical protein